MTEIERKFLVKTDDYKTQAFSSKRIAQGYLSSVPERTVRVRTKGSQGFLTIKGRVTKVAPPAWSGKKEITVSEAELLLAICEPGTIDKNSP